MASKSKPLIHVKLEYSEAVQAKRDILNSQANLLTMAKTIGNFLPLRTEELKKKLKLKSELRVIKKDLTKIQTLLPIPEIPKLLKDKVSIFEEDEEETKAKETEGINQNIYLELEDIQKKLRDLQG